MTNYAISFSHYNQHGKPRVWLSLGAELSISMVNRLRTGSRRQHLQRSRGGMARRYETILGAFCLF